MKVLYRAENVYVAKRKPEPEGYMTEKVIYYADKLHVSKDGALYPAKNVYVCKYKEIPGDFDFVIRGDKYIIGDGLDWRWPDYDDEIRYTINWGDGSVTVVDGNDISLRTHEYPYHGEWTITITDYVSGAVFFGHYNDWGTGNGLVRILSPLPFNDRLTNLEFWFDGSDVLEEISCNLFQNMPNINNLTGCFESCESLRKIHPDMFCDNPLVTSLLRIFGKCGLTEIPEGLFRNQIAATTYSSAFHRNPNLTRIPENLFANSPEVLDLSGIFYECFNLECIPEGLFTNNHKAATMQSCFYSCERITEIPGDLFANNPDIFHFGHTFGKCVGITGIPGGLFRNNKAALAFPSTFSQCINIGEIPTGLFDNSLSARNFQDTFSMPSTDNALTGLAPKLWTWPAAFPPFSPTGPLGSRCFSGCVGLDNYDDIPANWR